MTADILAPKEQRKAAKIAKWTAEAEPHGWQWLEQVDKAYGRYRHHCGHEQNVTKASMRKNTVRCKKCYEQKLQNEAKNAGLIWIKQTKPNRGLYTLPCGHTQEKQNIHVKELRVQCSVCKHETLKEASSTFCESYIRSEGDGYGIYKLFCGHIKRMQHSHAQRNKFACHLCEDSWATKPSDLYALHITSQGESLIKVGISNKLDHRTTQYGLPPGAEVTILKTVPFATGLEAKAAEQAILKTFRKHKFKDVNHIMTKSGATECFDPAVIDQILDSFPVM